MSRDYAAERAADADQRQASERSLPPPQVDPAAGPMLTCPLCGVTSRASRWPDGSRFRGRCPSCDQIAMPRVSTPDHGQRVAGQTSSTDPSKHEVSGPPSTADDRIAIALVRDLGIPLDEARARVAARKMTPEQYREWCETVVDQMPDARVDPLDAEGGS